MGKAVISLMPTWSVGSQVVETAMFIVSAETEYRTEEKHKEDKDKK